MIQRAKPSPAVDPSWPASQVDSCLITDLIPYARNARVHNAEQISRIVSSIQEFGFTVPILRDESGTVLAGHARLAAAQQMGLKTVPVITAHGWSEAKKRAYVLLDNQVALNADWDPELLKIELTDLQALDFDLDMLGFDADLERYLAETDEPDVLSAPTAPTVTPVPGAPPVNPPVDPSTLKFEPTLTPTLETKEYTDADLNREDDRLQKRFEQARKDPYRVVCPNCGEEFYIDV
mgnify:FL=1